jgi:trehalose/maltose hydrolase-like predicted phosphorylase
MIKREVVLPPEYLYPPDEWRVVEARFSDEYVARAETVFSLGNGFVGVCGSFSRRHASGTMRGCSTCRPAPNVQTGTAQYHINADIAYAIRRYVNVRGDVGILGARRVHHCGQRQHLHQSDGAAEPQLRRRHDPQTARGAARGLRRARASRRRSSRFCCTIPSLPRNWSELAFSLRFCSRPIRVRLTHSEKRYLVEEGEPLDVTVRGEPHLLSPGTALSRKAPPAARRTVIADPAG